MAVHAGFEPTLPDRQSGVLTSTLMNQVELRERVELSADAYKATVLPLN